MQIERKEPGGEGRFEDSEVRRIVMDPGSQQERDPNTVLF